MKLAPITLFVYNRPWHTKKTIEALQNNFLAKESDLFIFSDGPKNKESKNKVEKVRNYIKTISGFKKVKIIERSENFGLAKSIISGVTEVVNGYGKIIVLEDDLITSSHFLEYMNEALDLYEKEEKIISIHGYIYPIKKELPKTFFIKGADCWGWATWKRGWNLFESDGKKLLKELEEKKLTKEFDFNGTYQYTQMLRDQIEGKNDSWAIRWYASAFLKDKLTLYPRKPLIYNTGFDGSGTHCNSVDNFNKTNQRKNTKIKIEKIEAKENKKMRTEFEQFFKTLTKKPNILKKILHMTKKKIYKQNFFPGILGMFINPFYFARKGLYENIKAVSHHISGKVLDVGCGQKPYESLFSVDKYIGMDIEQSGHSHRNENIDVFYDGITFPFKESFFDSVISNEVLEHVFNPSNHLKEIHRVLKPNGNLLITVPFLWDEHEQPYDYARYSSFGLRHLLESNGFKIIEYKKSVSDIRVIFQMLNTYIYKKTVWLKRGRFRIIITIILHAPFNIAGEMLNLILPKNDDLYLDNIVIATKRK